MSLILNQSGNYSVKRNESIFYEGQKAQSLNILALGQVNVCISPSDNPGNLSENEITGSSYRLFSIDPNIFIGIGDLFLGKDHSFTYMASEDCSLQIVLMPTMEQVRTFLKNKTDYLWHIISAISAMAGSCAEVLRNLESLEKELSVINNNLVMFYWALREKAGFSHIPSSTYFREGLEIYEAMKEKGILLPSGYEASSVERDYSDLTETEPDTGDLCPLSKKDYYQHLSNVPADVRKSFFGADPYIGEFHCCDAASVLEDLQAKLKEVLRNIELLMGKLYSDSDSCIFAEYYRIAMNEKDNLHVDAVFEALEYIVGKAKDFALLFKEQYGHDMGLDSSYLDFALSRAKAASPSIELKKESSGIPEELKGSLEKILAYSELPQERLLLFRRSMDAFVRLQDKLSQDEQVRSIKNSITQIYFEIYQSVFKRVAEEKNSERLYQMFLTYGYMDERLLDEESLAALYKFTGRQQAAPRFPIYSINEWLQSIYSMKKDPSIDEFGQDYFDVFRELKRRGAVTEKDKLEYDGDRNKRLDFEISNMFRTNNKLCHGQISMYFPVLHREMITRELSKSIVTPELVSECLDRILETDFSAFHREISYRNADKGIEKEFVMKAVLPDIILLPVFGSRGVMWQEITGRNRNSPGRLMLPAFTAENLYDLLLKLVGNFRWELCRTMMGVAWNDITQKSLTSEYTDYIQFFKKNRELSEEAKEKTKAQVQKYRNMMRDIFTADYETWINHESKGVVRLNKVVRGILYRHCPFSRPIREQLEKQPLFADPATQFRNTRAKTVKELENRYGKYTKNGETLDPDFEHNLKFYKEM